MTKAFYPGHTAAGGDTTRIIIESFHLHGALMTAGDRLGSPLGLTSARWQLLSALACRERPESVSHIARNVGRVRQSVQRVANELRAGGFITFEPNPHHQRAPLLTITPKGRKALKAITALQVPWVNDLAKGLSPTKLSATLDTLHELRLRLEEQRAPKRAR
ncbi:MAG: MarR family transcriptional regulator [Nitrospiraceae bacterium]